MKTKILSCILAICFCYTLANAQLNQNSPGQRRIMFHTIGKDSIDLQLNEDYELIEDSCASVVRHTHVNMRDKKFFGPFKDVSKIDPNIVLSEGNYTTNGTKDGLFTARYLNGNVKSKGAYKNGKFEGKWETYYDDNKPEMVFSAVDDTISIIDAWGKNGKKIIDNGKGTYQVSLGALTWKGKLYNGRPDGTWHGFKTDDATETSLIDETYKKGKFINGNSPIKSYTDASRIVLIDPGSFSYSKVETFRVSAIPCNGKKRKHVVGAQYEDGLSAFTGYIMQALSPITRNPNFKIVSGVLQMEGEVSVSGEIVNIKATNSFNETLAREVGMRLRTVPPLHPATIDGKPITQKVLITVTFSNGGYYANYRFLPIVAQ